jgi:uncharacterized protein (TIGR03118 family)
MFRSRFPKAAATLPLFETMENRRLMSTTLFDQTNLVSDQFGVAQVQDRTLINAWGISSAPTQGAFWVSSAGKNLSELYIGDVNGSAIARPIKVNVPGTPTGQVFNINQPLMGTGNSTDFSVSDGTNKGASVFIFATKSGKIFGWSPAVGHQIPLGGGTISDQAEVGFSSNDDAIYTGLAIGNVGNSHFLYAADFNNHKIDVINGQFHKTHLSGSFSDPNLPSGYGPHNVQNLGGHLFVTYAKEDSANPGREVFGAGKGFVDEFSTSGRLIRRVASGGSLNAPWGVAIAPKSFGSFGGDLLVGNLGDGHITSFDPSKNFATEGQLKNANGSTIAIDGLWGLQFGNGQSAGDANALYFAAGPGHYQHGLFGSIRIARDITANPFVDAGKAGLRVVGTGDTDTVSITDDVAHGITTVITDGRTQVFDHLFSEIDILMSGKHNHITLDLAGKTSVSVA